MKFVFAYVAFSIVAYAQQEKAPQYVKVNNTCSNFKSATNMSAILGIWKVQEVHYICEIDIRCTKFYFAEKDGIYIGYYRPVPPNVQEAYGVPGIYVEDPEKPGTMERFNNNSTQPMAIKTVIAFQHQFGFATFSCDAVDGAPINVVGVYGYKNVSDKELDEFRKAVAEAAPNLKLQLVDHDFFKCSVY